MEWILIIIKTIIIALIITAPQLAGILVIWVLGMAVPEDSRVFKEDVMAKQSEIQTQPDKLRSR